MNTFANSLWSATASPAPVCRTLIGPVESDVVVVGGGYTGLSAALHLACEGKSVTVLEADEPGFGCSGRNGGQVNPGSTRMLPSEVIRTLGPYWGERFLQFGHQSSALVFDLIDRYAIDCEAVRPGYVQGGYGSRGQRINEAWANEWRERGVDIKTFDRDQVNGLIGTRAYQFGLLDPRGGNVQPLSYVRGLARAARSEGAQIYGHSRAEKIEKRANDWRVTTQSGTVAANSVLLATNGYTDNLWPGLRQSVVPTASYLAATMPLNDTLLASILTGRHAVSETARVLVYYRRDETGRFIIGTHGNLFDTREGGNCLHVQREAERLFPQLAGVRWDYFWGGWPAITKNHTPHIFELDQRVYAGLGYNGRGVGSATLMGAQLAALVLDSAEPLIEVKSLQRFAMHRFRQIGISYHLLSRKALDRLSRGNRG